MIPHHISAGYFSTFPKETTRFLGRKRQSQQGGIKARAVCVCLCLHKSLFFLFLAFVNLSIILPFFSQCSPPDNGYIAVLCLAPIVVEAITSGISAEATIAFSLK